MKELTIDETGDLVFTNGDFKVSTSDEQDCILLVNTSAGAWKQYPTVGVGIFNYLGSTGQTAALRKAIVEQMTADRFVNIQVDLQSDLSGAFNYSITADRNE